ncbi:MAG: ArsR family transcriptional regulator [Candidatus Woesearchaeota archaeon]
MPDGMEITLRKVRKPHEQQLNAQIKWLGDSLGLFSLRDKDSSCYRIFIELVKSSKLQKPLSSDEMAYRLNLTRGTVVHHLNKLMKAGLVTKANNKYQLRQNTLYHVVEDLEKDVQRLFDEIKAISKSIDETIFS